MEWDSKSTNIEIDVDKVSNSKTGVVNTIVDTDVTDGYSYTVTITSHAATGWICFGFMPRSVLEEADFDWNKSEYKNGVNFCTDNTLYNAFGPENKENK